MTVAGVTSSTISVQWASVPCIHQNGDIRGYSVQYKVMGSGNTQTMNVTGGGTTQTTISGLTPSTDYSIQVAAVNSAGTGVYSNPVLQRTSMSYSFPLLFCVFRDISPAPSPPTDVRAVQNGPTSIIVTWSPSTGATGYRIQYDSTGGHNGSDIIDGNDTASLLLTGLENGQTYTISVVATFQDLSSNAIQIEVILSKIHTDIFSNDFILHLYSSPSSRTGVSEGEFHNSQFHLPLLECCQWQGGQLGGDVETH